MIPRSSAAGLFINISVIDNFNTIYILTQTNFLGNNFLYKAKIKNLCIGINYERLIWKNYLSIDAGFFLVIQIEKDYRYRSLYPPDISALITFSPTFGVKLNASEFFKK